MDQRTVDVYNDKAEEFSDQYFDIYPAKLYEIITDTFHLGGLSLDVGCGNGRDVGWMLRHDYRAEGIDASFRMLEIAKNLLPGVEFFYGSLPSLSLTKVYHNILCSGVLMHLPEREVFDSIRSMFSVLAPGGKFIFSYRFPRADAVDDRESDGRLYTKLNISKTLFFLEQLGSRSVSYTHNRDHTRNDIVWTTVYGQKLR